MKGAVAIAALFVAFGGQGDALTVSKLLTERLNLFQNAQRACEGMFLSNAKAAEDALGATERPLSAVCECAALLTVSALQDRAVIAILRGDHKAAATTLIAPLKQNIERCINQFPS
ncbi:MAG TPA: hypothetical protein VFW88_06965 [Burkholderiales bacterium]|nr:hypothetical protein [Burkholderiales bacterium]